MKFFRLAIITVMLPLGPAVALAAPDGFAINSDSPSTQADSLYRIDLATGAETRLGFVRSQGATRLDVEGLAFAPDGTLYAVDDESKRLFPLNPDNGQVLSDQEVSLKDMPTGAGADYGMTFGCDSNLYVSVVNSNFPNSVNVVDSLYRLSLDGTATRIGAEGALGRNISALAAWGNPVQLYGLGNGVPGQGQSESRTLYSIDTTTGIAVAIGTGLGPAAGTYEQAGLAFDSDGQLWAITDRRAVANGPFPSQILRIDTTTGLATAVSNTVETGYESLAITLPRGCGGGGGGDRATFTVQSRFVDNNNQTPVTLRIDCNSGQILDQEKTVTPNEGVLGEFEVEFVVTSFDDGELNCSITQDPPAGYTPSYTCLGASLCEAVQSSDDCSFQAVANGSENLCQVQNYPNPVAFTVTKEWLFEADELGEIDTTRIDLLCQNVFDGDGQLQSGDDMSWSWNLDGNDQRTAQVVPDFAGGTYCSATESTPFSAVEAENGCEGPIPVRIGDGALGCTITNTVFLEGIPTLNDYGRLLMALLLLGAGASLLRRP